MRFLFDIFPVVIFFATYKYTDVFTATIAAIGATALQVVWKAIRRQRIDPALWVSFGVVSLFGGATVVLRDDTFIRWKPTVLYWIFATTLIIAKVTFQKNLIKLMMGSELKLEESVWKQLNNAWISFFTAMGCLNLLVAFRNPFCTDADTCLAQWVNFKLFGSIGLMLLFIIGQTVFLARHLDESDT